MENSKAVGTPLDPGYNGKCNNDCELADKEKYQSVIGALSFLAVTTRPDIQHSVSKLAQHNTNPHAEHMVAVKHILRYLRGTAEFGLKFEKGDSVVHGYVDSDWGSDAIDRKSYTGYVFFIGNSVVSWESKKQQTVALSTTEAEYMAMSNASKEAIYLGKFLEELGYSDGSPIQLNVDNQGAIKLAMNPVYHNRTKHIDIKFHHVREVIRRKEVELRYCPTEEMIADIMTKNLSKTKHNEFMKLMKMK
ncbi:uncharacterized protein LOC142242423 [Haematobia irritans]|uniref:uncharacterized protein LOC142242423 n=1 Tax=Haematobia irritans TaxID=7368 RepID=UPI003F4FF108